MPEHPWKRRHWPWMLLALGLLLFAGRIAYRFRPLTNAERSTVGHWIEHLRGVQTHYRFEADRTFTTEHGEVGSWSASSTTISIRFERRFDDYAFLNFPNQVYAYLRNQLPHSYAQRWDGPDRFRIGPKEFVQVKHVQVKND